MSIDVKQMTIEYIKQHGYDGLCNDDCGCGIDALAPCGEPMSTCNAAFKGTDGLFYAEAKPRVCNQTKNDTQATNTIRELLNDIQEMCRNGISRNDVQYEIYLLIDKFLSQLPDSSLSDGNLES
jgi:hypothetical protein